MKDWKTTVVGILTLIGVVVVAAKSLLTCGFSCVDFKGVSEAVFAGLVAWGFIKAADSK
jgi:hypothetical protein